MVRRNAHGTGARGFRVGTKVERRLSTGSTCESLSELYYLRAVSTADRESYFLDFTHSPLT
jgi:hypothetical protein